MRRRARRALAAGLLSAAGLAACAPPAPPPEEDTLERLPRDPIEALAALRRNGDSLSAGLAVATLLSRYQKLGWAHHHAGALARRQPDSVEAWRLYYLVALSAGLDDEAVEAAQRTLELGGEDARILRHLGIVSLHQRRIDEAGELLERSLALDAAAAATHYALGRARELAGDDRGAVEAYRTVTTLEPHHPRADWRRARLLARLGEAEAAYQLLVDIVARPAPPPEALYLLATLETRRGDAARGRQRLEDYEAVRIDRRQARERREQQDHAASEALDALLVDGPEAALAVVARLRREYGEDLRLDLVEAEARLRSGQIAGAAELLAPAVRAHPQGWRYLALYAGCLQRLGLAGPARDAAARAVALQPLALETRRLLLSIAEELGDASVATEQRRALDVLQHFAPPEDPTARPQEADEARTALVAALIRGAGAPPPTEDEDAIPMD